MTKLHLFFLLLIIILVLGEVHSTVNFVNTDPNADRPHDRPQPAKIPTKQPWYTRISEKVKDFTRKLREPTQQMTQYVSKVRNFVKRQVSKVFSKKVFFKTEEVIGDHEYIVKIEIPAPKEDLAVVIHSNGPQDTLIVSGRFKAKSTDIKYQTFEKEFPIPVKAIKERTFASMQDGVLTIKVQKMIEKDQILVPIQ